MKNWIIGIATLLMITACAVAPATASDCPEFTDEQNYILDLAYVTGNQQNQSLHNSIGERIGYTQASVIWKESFIGDHIIRFRSSDGDYGSYGVGMVQLSTAFHMNGIPDTYENRDEIAPNMISQFLTNDQYAISESYKYLTRMIETYNSLWYGVYKYNGSGERAEEYVEDIRNRVRILMTCKDWE